jgi:protein-L-isoaspartate(D-aspartate) O-methyltransferase
MMTNGFLNLFAVGYSHPLLVALVLLSSCRGHSQNTDIYRGRRELMVIQQIASRGISDQRVIDAMRKVERHLFVPSELASEAYSDRALPIGYSQTISQPYIVAFMTEVLALKSTDKVLEIGTGSGYQAAILAEICDTVYTIEIVPELALRAKNLLGRLDYGNIVTREGDGYQGWPGHAPFQAIIVTCSPTHVPEPLTEQLAEGGKMIIPVGERFSQRLVLLEKRKGKLVQQSVLAVSFVPMVDDEQQEY